MVKSILLRFLITDNLQGYKHFYKTKYYPKSHELEGHNVLDTLIRSGSIKIIGFLLENRIDPNMILKGNKTPTELCYSYKKYGLAKIFAKHDNTEVSPQETNYGFQESNRYVL
ncbi:MAG: hypothetical protein ISR65_19210 [Bacteriovoracaceae bacterium]|nr:hypothetical protein [Bacteriovoracaceae bacterium]